MRAITIGYCEGASELLVNSHLGPETHGFCFIQNKSEAP
jgi:hypothetical protein